MTAGIWRPLRLEVYSSRIEDLWTRIEVDKSLMSASGTIHAQIEGPSDRVEFNISLSGKTIFQQDTKVSETGYAELKVSIANPQLWYPNGYGAQILYDVSVSIYRGTCLVDTVSKRTGLRRGELVQDTDDIGKSFYFRVNNVDIFCAGSCWIPADNFLPQIGADRYRKWLEAMIDGNQIMTRYGPA